MERAAGYTFGGFELSPNGPELRREGQRVSVPPKVLSTLLVLVQRHGQVVSKADLMAAVWPDCFVEEGNLTQNIFTLRKLLASEFGQKPTIETITRQGYRFVVPVAVTSEAPSLLALPAATLPPASEPACDVQDEPGREPPGVAWWRAKSAVYFAGVLTVLLLCVFGIALMRPQGRFLKAPARRPSFDLQRLTSNTSSNPITAVAVSSDGHLLAYADADGVELRPMNSGRLQTIKVPQIRSVRSLEWFPDGLHLLVAGDAVTSGDAQLWQLSVNEDAPHLLMDGAESGAISWSCMQLAFLRKRGTELWLANATGEQAHRVRVAQPGTTFTTLLWDSNDRHLLLEQHGELASPTYRRPGSDEVSPEIKGRMVAINPASGSITSVVPDTYLASAAAVGQHSLLFTRSTLAASPEASTMWRVDLDPVSGGFASTPKLVASLEPGQPHIYAFAADRSGSVIVTRSEQGPVGVYVGSWDEARGKLSEVRQLSQDGDTAYPHAWLPNASAVLYEAYKAGQWQIFEHAMSEHNGRALVFSKLDQYAPRVTPDGRWILFLGRWNERETLQLYRVPVAGGVPVRVTADPNFVQVRCPLQTGQCLAQMVGEKGRHSYHLLDAVAGIGAEVFDAPAAWDDGDWDISPDGKTLALLSPNPNHAGIHLIGLDHRDARELPGSEGKGLVAVNWGPVADQLFVTALDLSGRFVIEMVSMRGNVQPIQSTQRSTWAVVSQDGKRIAFTDQTVDSNLWLLQVQPY